MTRALARPRHPDRKAIGVGLRALAALVALLLGVTSLGEATHFLVVPHAICAEHGELVELRQGASEAHEHDETDAQKAPASAPASGDVEHDHCDVVAQAQREQLLPPLPAFEVPGAGDASVSVAVALEPRVERPLDLLRLAPKTSPPRARA